MMTDQEKDDIEMASMRAWWAGFRSLHFAKNPDIFPAITREPTIWFIKGWEAARTIFLASDRMKDEGRYPGVMNSPRWDSSVAPEMDRIWKDS